MSGLPREGHSAVKCNDEKIDIPHEVQEGSEETRHQSFSIWDVTCQNDTFDGSQTLEQVAVFRVVGDICDPLRSGSLGLGLGSIVRFRS